MESDRDLLARLRVLNQEIGRFTVEMLHRQDGGALPADGLRPLAEHLFQLSVDMRDRADEIDGLIIDQESDDA